MTFIPSNPPSAVRALAAHAARLLDIAGVVFIALACTATPRPLWLLALGIGIVITNTLFFTGGVVREWLKERRWRENYRQAKEHQARLLAIARSRCAANNVDQSTCQVLEELVAGQESNGEVREVLCTALRDCDLAESVLQLLSPSIVRAFSLPPLAISTLCSIIEALMRRNAIAQAKQLSLILERILQRWLDAQRSIGASNIDACMALVQKHFELPSAAAILALAGRLREMISVSHSVKPISQLAAANEGSSTSKGANVPG